MAVGDRELRRLVRAARRLPPELLEELIGLVRSLSRRRARPVGRRRSNLARYAGILPLNEDPLDYQRRVRAEWDDR